MFNTQEQTHVYEADTIDLPSIQGVLGAVPDPDPVRRRNPSKQQKPFNNEMISVVRRIIAHLENSR